MIHSTSNLGLKNIFRCLGRTYYRTPENDRFYDITFCNEPLHNGTLDDNDGVLMDAVQVSKEFIADIVGHAEQLEHIAKIEDEKDRQYQLAKAESAIERYLEYRWSRVRRSVTKKKLRQKQKAQPVFHDLQEVI